MIDQFRYGKAYSVRQAARLAGVSPSTIRRWLTAGEPAADVSSVSFLQLIEMVVVAQFRRGKRPIPFDRLRCAHAFAQERLGTLFPFASLDLREHGGQLLHEFDASDAHGPALTLDIDGHWAIPGCSPDPWAISISRQPIGWPNDGFRPDAACQSCSILGSVQAG